MLKATDNSLIAQVTDVIELPDKSRFTLPATASYFLACRIYGC